MFEDFRKRPLREQIFISFIGATIVSLLATSLTGVLVLDKVNNDVKDKSNEILTKQIQTNSATIMGEMANLFERMLKQNTEGFLYPIAHSTEDTYRTDYCLNNDQRSYLNYGYDCPVCLGADYDLEFDSRHQTELSLEHSGYYVPGATPYDVRDFSADINQTRDQTVHIEPYMITGYDYYTFFVLGYVGFENEGVFRQYPGRSTYDTDPNREYDPRVRGWYVAAKAEQDKTIYTEPYLDFHGLGWMISIAKAMHSVDTGEFIGVASADMLIDDIKQQITSNTFLDTGKMTLFQLDGTVVADIEWDNSMTNPDTMSYSDLQNPPISDNLWNSLISSDPLEPMTVEEYAAGTNDAGEELGEYFVSSYPLEELGYLIMITVPRDEILAPMKPIESDIDDSMQATVTNIIGISTGIFILVVVIVAVITIYTTRPINEMRRNTEMIVERTGQADQFSGIQMTSHGAGMGEFEELRQGFGQMVSTLEEERKKKQVPIRNVFYGQTTAPWHSTAHQQVMGGASQYPEGVPVIAVLNENPVPVQIPVAQPVNTAEAIPIAQVAQPVAPS